MITKSPVTGGTVGGKENLHPWTALNVSSPPLSELLAHSAQTSFARTASVPSLLAPGVCS